MTKSYSIVDKRWYTVDDDSGLGSEWKWSFIKLRYVQAYVWDFSE